MHTPARACRGRTLMQACLRLHLCFTLALMLRHGTPTHLRLLHPWGFLGASVVAFFARSVMPSCSSVSWLSAILFKRAFSYAERPSPGPWSESSSNVLAGALPLPGDPAPGCHVCVLREPVRLQDPRNTRCSARTRHARTHPAAKAGSMLAHALRRGPARAHTPAAGARRRKDPASLSLGCLQTIQPGRTDEPRRSPDARASSAVPAASADGVAQTFPELRRVCWPDARSPGQGCSSFLRGARGCLPRPCASARGGDDPSSGERRRSSSGPTRASAPRLSLAKAEREGTKEDLKQRNAMRP